MNNETESFRSALINEADRLNRGDLDVNENAEDVALNIMTMCEEYAAMVGREAFLADDEVDEAEAIAADVF